LFLHDFWADNMNMANGLKNYFTCAEFAICNLQKLVFAISSADWSSNIFELI